MHPLHASHTQRVRSKLIIPVLVGRSPRNSIDKKSLTHYYKKCSKTEKNNLNKAAMYYLTLNSPWILQKNETKRNKIELIPEDGFTFKDFVRFMATLKCCDRFTNTYKSSFINRCIYSYIIDTSRNMRTKITNKVMAAKYRGRLSDIWEEYKKGPAIYPKIQTVCQSVNYWRWKHSKRNKNFFDNDTNNNSDDALSDDKETRELIQLLQNELTDYSELENNKNDLVAEYLQNSLNTFNDVGTVYVTPRILRKNEFGNNALGDKIWEEIRENNMV